MNCKPGDLARITGMPSAMAAANDRFVRIKNSPPNHGNGLVEGGVWDLEELEEVVLLGNITYQGVQIWIGETVVFNSLPDKYLRPIRDQPGADETLLWAPVPSEVTA